MGVPTIQLMAKKAANDSPNKISAIYDPEVAVKQPTERVVWGVWTSGLGVAVMSCFIFPFLGVPAALVAIFSYVDHKTNDQDGYKRKRKIARRLGAVALIIGIILLGMMFACKIARWRKHHDHDRHDKYENKMPGAYCHRPNSDCYGRDINHFNGLTTRECLLECKWNPACFSVQFNRDFCWLKNHRCTDAELVSARRGNDYVKSSNDFNCTAGTLVFN